MMKNTTIFWFRRDLRLQDNHGLFQALQSGQPVLPIFIFDRKILDDLTNRSDARVSFIHQEITAMQAALRAIGSDLHVFYGEPEAVFAQEILAKYQVASVYTNHDFEPYARTRDAQIGSLCREKGADFKTFKDHVIFQYDEVLKSDGTPYVVFTPYSRVWKALALEKNAFQAYDSEVLSANFAQVSLTEQKAIASLESMGFTPSDLPLPGREVKAGVIRTYDQTRNFPALPESTSRLGLHFRFGTISIREKARKAAQLNETFLSELIWRDFYAQILAHFPHVVTGAFRAQYDKVAWRDAPDEFARWCKGQTGYPLVDAGMRELNATGYMHNRVRMVVASFLTKHLMMSWQHGEAYFAEKLLDFDLASNSGGWQWAAGCGTDAAPYFRIFNPEEQMKKFDSKLEYVRKWVPEYGTPRYVAPIVEHKFARERCLATYKAGLE
jgi:deoxyribodipyrimidine photo-lyase